MGISLNKIIPLGSVSFKPPSTVITGMMFTKKKSRLSKEAWG